MIIIQKVIINGKTYIRTYSDAGRYLIREDGVVYEEAVDVENSGHTYTEGDILPDVEITAEEALSIIVGGGASDEE
jgi:hypothetical protein